MSKIRVFLVDDHTIMREGLVYLLKEEADIEVVGTAENGHRMLKDVKKTAPDVVVVDITMPVLGGLEATQQLKKLLPKAKVLILTMHTDENYVHQAFKLGASGYLVKKGTTEDLVSAIKAVYRGETYISPAVSERVVQEFLRSTRLSPKPSFPDKLTFRERQILKLIAEGWPSKKIGDHLNISTRTVETHRANIMQKLKLHKVADLVKYAIRRGLVQVEP
jgi:two-component system response regulator NreC